MNSPLKTILLGVFAVTILALGVLVFQQRQQLQELAQAATDGNAARDALQKRLEESEQRIATAEKARGDLKAEIQTLRARAAAPSLATARAANPAAAMAALDNPAVQKMLASSMRSGLDQRYAMLFKKLQLSPADLEKLKDLLVEKQMSGLDVVRASQAQGLAGKDITALMGKMQAESDEGIHALLGDSAFGQFQEFNQNSGSHNLLDQMERRLNIANAPLQASQSEALLRIFKETGPAAPVAAGGAAMASFVQGMGNGNPVLSAMTQPRISDETIAAAQPILNPAQLDALKQLQTEQKNQAAMMQSLRGSVPAAPAQSAPRPQP